MKLIDNRWSFLDSLWFRSASSNPAEVGSKPEYKWGGELVELPSGMLFNGYMGLDLASHTVS